jgi:hypothetical protein
MLFAAAALTRRRDSCSEQLRLVVAVAALAIGAACALQGVDAALREADRSPDGGMATSVVPATLSR